ncbi:MAG TPA: PAS domain-containing protein [Roseiflexaceae bacterium]|nr:PAS domain-containing protein [Roseiflexaceae bacterium]
MEIEPFGRRIQALHQRVRILYRRVSQDSPQHNLLPQAFEELQTALEELDEVNVVLHRQQQEIENTRAFAEVERQSYQELFDQAPEPYLITSLEGNIRRANRTAAQLFGTEVKFLIGRPLVFFIPEGERRAFRSELIRVPERGNVRDWELRMLTPAGRSLEVALTVATGRDRMGKPLSLRWLVHDISERKREDALLRQRLAELEQELSELRRRGPRPRDQAIPAPSAS